MTVAEMLAWIAGIGSLLYFAAAMIYPTWFIGEESEAPPSTSTDATTRWSKPLDFDDWPDWQQLGHPK